MFNYWEADTVFHRANPIVKVLLTFLLLISMFFTKKVEVMVVFFATFIMMFWLADTPWAKVKGFARMIFWLVLITFLLNLFYSEEGKILWQFWKLKITEKGLYDSIYFSLRFVNLILLVQLLLGTTQPIDVATVVGRVFKPLARLFPSAGFAEMEIMLLLALRFLPIFQNEIEWLIKSKRARGIVEDTFTKKVDGIVGMVVPLLISAFKRAEELAVALELRGFDPFKERTSYVKWEFSMADVVVILFYLILIFAVIIQKKMIVWDI